MKKMLVKKKMERQGSDLRKFPWLVQNRRSGWLPLGCDILSHGNMGRSALQAWGKYCPSFQSGQWLEDFEVMKKMKARDKERNKVGRKDGGEGGSEPTC